MLEAVKMSLRWLYCENGKPSATKLNRQIAFGVATWVVLWQCWRDMLSTELFAMYITVFTGVELARRWQTLKYGDTSNDYDGRPVREEDRPSRRNGREEGKRSGSAGEGE